MMTSHGRRDRLGASGPLAGRVAVVTGAARGLGQGLAYALSRHGARVALVGLEGERLARLASELPGAAAHWTVDVTDADGLAATAEAVRRTLGRPSVVVANAGVALGGPLLDCDTDAWRRVIEVNVVGSALTARCFLPDLLHTRGYYLQVASMAALAPAPLLTAYCASKAGVEAFAHALGAEVAHRGVGVGIAYLNWADTAMIREADKTAVFRELRTNLPWPASDIHDPASYVRAMLRGIERRSTHIYAPPWLRATQAARALLPAVVTHRSRQVLAARGNAPLPPTGLLGPGGAAADPARTGGPHGDPYRPEE
ncbi:SDR family oxidoreductase [Streptomyces sp. TX20-6-3]|uniref:SDR family oxidoreductase n=1 Tax=Streptomyces sp. TX20-6-3 TaxID=3028705 RepID=UPI0029BE1C71|nr:SDR family oxidoreductase [Streptomyces sp. TX20-6-3]MDX2564440.1 SDR family oxidoreductase [Streptomyces sp. TX20-6-3]